VGVVIVPMSLARLHHRKDAAHRPLTDGPHSTVALVWRDDGPTPPLVDAFIGSFAGAPRTRRAEEIRRAEGTRAEA
jgi:DNA-binding transcriptional LysR family regulator